MRTRSLRQRGVALITALLIMFMAVAIASHLAQQLNMSMRRSGNIINSNQAYLYALGAETLAIIGLNEDIKANKIDSYDDFWAMEYDPFPVEDGAGYIYVKVKDLQGRFNINNLINKDGKLDPVSIERFRRLLVLFGIDPEVSNAVIDWMDKDHNAQGQYGAEDDYYLGLEQPYRCANRPLTSVSELRLVRGLDTAEQFNELAQQLIALPEHTPINVNLASYEIHYAIIGDVQKAALAVRHSKLMLEQALENQSDDAQQAQQEQEYEMQREMEMARSMENTGQRPIPPRPVIQPTPESILPYNDVNEYVAKNNLQQAIKNNTISQNDLSVDSQYFLVEGEAELDRARATVKSVLQREKNGKIRILSRTQGEL